MSGAGEAAAPRARVHLAVAALYLLAALWTYRAVLPEVRTALPLPPDRADSHRTATMGGDLRLVVALLIHDARAFLGYPARLFDGVQCYPLPSATTLGEHVIAEGLLAVPTYFVTGDPIVSYNVTLIVVLWVGALSMYAFTLYWTRSVSAALVAGFLASFHPVRIANPAHPFVTANLWTPLVLLFAHRLAAHRRWRDAFGLAATTAMQLLESLYQVIAFSVIAGAYGVSLLWHYARSLARALPQLACVALATAALAVTVFGPYLDARRALPVLAGRHAILFRPADFGLGGQGYAGTVCLGLALLGLGDRLRRARPRDGTDPRWPLVAATVLLFWASVWEIPLPGGGGVPSLYTLASRVLPGLDAIRVAFLVHWGVKLVAAFLAGYGVLVLVEGRRRSVRAAVTALCLALAAIETFHPVLSRATFRYSSELVAEPVRPAPGVETVLGRVGPGPVLDLPFPAQPLLGLLLMPRYVLLSAFHHQRVAACYASFPSPLRTDVAALATRLPAASAADALYALGFRSLIVHRELFRPAAKADAIVGGLLDRALPGTRGALVAISEEADRPVLLRLESDVPVDASLAALVPAERAPDRLRGPLASVELAFRTPGPATYRHPDPILPTPVRLRWRTADGAVAAEAEARILLPIAIAAGDQAVRALSLDVPVPAGSYVLEVVPEAMPEHVIARRAVQVLPPL